MRGGARKGAGRPSILKSESKAKPNRTIRLSDEEYEQVKGFVKKIRKDAKSKDVIAN